MPKITLSGDKRTATLDMDRQDGRTEHLDAAAIDRLICELADARARMAPAFTGRYRIGETPTHACDNLMWEIQADPSRRGICLAFQHPGLGWMSLGLSRAQVEDLVTGIEFTLAEMRRMPGRQKLRTGERADPEHAPAAAIPLRRVGG